MKLPVVLSSMIAAIAISGALASEQTAPDAGAAAPDAAAPADTGAAAPAPADTGKKKHHRKKRKGGGQHHADTNQPTDSYKKSFDQNNYELPKADGDASVDNSPKAGPMEQPGQKMGG